MGTELYTLSPSVYDCPITCQVSTSRFGQESKDEKPGQYEQDALDSSLTWTDTIRRGSYTSCQNFPRQALRKLRLHLRREQYSQILG